MAGAVVEGYQDLQRALKRADRDIRLGMRKELREVAGPVQATAERNAVDRIRNIGVEWPRMRIGITQKSVYVAPAQRGVGSRATPGQRTKKRPNLAPLLMDRAMQPALDQHQEQIMRDLERMLDRVADKFNRGF
jgi:hypothetical protein